MTPGEKFHPSNRHWHGGMPESIANTTHKDEPTSAIPEWAKDHFVGELNSTPSPLNIVDVYCPNTGCEWHVRVADTVKEYNLTKHLLENCQARLSPDWMDERPQEGAGDEDTGTPNDSSTPVLEGRTEAPVNICPSLPSEVGPNDELYLMVEGAKQQPPWSWEEGWVPRHPNSERFHQILQELGELHDRKQADYGRGDDPFANVRSSEEWGLAPWVGAMVRLNDKVRRLQSLASKGDLKNEAAEDSFRDISVYAIIALVLYEQGLQDGE